MLFSSKNAESVAQVRDMLESWLREPGKT